MREFFEKYKKWIIIAVLVVIAAGVLIRRQVGTKDSAAGTAYVETVENLTGQNASLGMINKFAGIVEAQGTWSVTKNSSVEVEEIYVSEGDEVEEGQALFVYSTDKYEEDLQQARIDLERLHNEYDSAQATIAQLEKEKRSASSSEQANYTVQIKEQNLELKSKDLDIRMKEMEIEKLESNIENAEVKSAIAGVVKSINESDSSSTSGDNSFITVMKTGTFRVKGTINEQNIGNIYVDAPVLVYSRVNDNVWKGRITQIDTENTVASGNSGYSSQGSNGGSKYPFYVELESSEGLIMGQHVYIQPDPEQGEESAEEGLWLPDYVVDQTDPENPFVWKDVNGRLRKQEVTIAEVNEELGKVKISEGVTLEDSLCIPDGTQSAGMKTAPMSERPDETAETGTEEGVEEVPAEEGVEGVPAEEGGGEVPAEEGGAVG